jgi:uncharacterized protein YcfL
MRIHLLIALLLLAGCSSRASKQDQLNAAANESTQKAANVLAGAAQNGMNEETALNEAASAEAANAGASNIHKEARPNSAKNPSPPQPVEPSQEEEPGNSNSD